jgi:hypothetical protein
MKIKQVVWKAKSKNIKFYLIVAIFNLTLNSFAQKTYIDEEKIPYGFMEFDGSLVFTQSQRYSYQGYTITGPSPYNSWQTAQIPYTDVVKTTLTGIGAGIDLHVPFIYLFVHQNKSRFRIADDLGLGTYLSSNTLKRTNELTKESIPAYAFNTMPSINGSIIFYLGVQGCFRINETFDIGARFTPLFLYYDFQNGTVYAPTYGLHLRVKRFFIDYRITPDKSKDHTSSTGFSCAGVKYLIHPSGGKKLGTYVSASLTFMHYKASVFHGAPPPIEYSNYKTKFDNWNTLRLGYGLLF